MELWAHIKGKDYPIEYGAVFNDELSETLDSGTVKLPHVFEEIDIKPYDDVIVHSYGIGGLAGKRSFSAVFVPGEGEFYRHMLAYDIVRRQLTMDEGYDYEISLISETKGLEKTILPDISILQPQEGLVFRVGDKIRDYLELYSPKLKVANSDGETWDYIQKYRVSDSVVDYFNDTFAPELVLSQPTLREAINQLMQTKDCICVIHDGWVEYINVAKRGNYVNTENDPTCAGRLWMMNGDSYCDKLKRNYQSSISKQTTSRLIERMGFRNFESGTLTLSNLQLNFSHPIYKIEKMTMCYYKKVKINGDVKTILCRHNITPLVKLNSEKAILNADWNEFNKVMSNTSRSESRIATIGQLAKYKFAVVGYDMYSKTIGGWGDQYSWITGDFAVSKTSTLIENLIAFMEQWNPAGDDYKYYLENDAELESFNIEPYKNLNEIRRGDSPIISSFGDDKTRVGKDWYITMFDGISAWASSIAKAKVVTHFTVDIKSVFFECEYMGFVEGTTEISKDFHDGDITHNDQVANPFTYTESDGIFEKEKVNRMGNAAWTVTQRATDLGSIYNLGDVDAINDEDRIIYRRSISVNKDYFMANYSECEDFVMKNYFTSVFSKKRPYQLGNFGDSVSRREVRNQQILLSTSTSMYNGESYKISFANGQHEFLESALSFFKASELDDNMNPVQNLNSSFFKSYGKTYLCDSQKYVNGYSLCFGISMCDSASAGVYIRQMIPDYDSSIDNEWKAIWESDKNTILEQNILTDMKGEINNITGAIQDWHMLTDGTDAGYIDEMSFCIGDKEETFIVGDKRAESENVTDSIVDYYKNHLMALPLVNHSTPYSPKMTSTLSSLPKAIRKDGKELLSFTFQFEPVCDERNQIAFSEYMMALSDLNGAKRKFELSQNIPYTVTLSVKSIKTDKLKEIAGGSGDLTAAFYPEGLSLDVVIPNLITSKKDFTMQVGKRFEFKKITAAKDIDDKVAWSAYGARYANFVIMFGSITVNYIKINSGTITANITKNLTFQTAQYVGMSGSDNGELTYITGGVNRKKEGTSDVVLLNEITSSARNYYSPEGVKYEKDRMISKGSSLYSYMMFTSDDNMNYDFDEHPSYPNYFLCEEGEDNTETISFEDTLRQNLIYAIGGPITPDTKYEKLRNAPESQVSGRITWKEDGNGAKYLSVEASEAIGDPERSSIRLYYLEDGVYNLVFAVMADPNRWNGATAFGKKVYASMVDDRSKTVYDRECDPTYRTANFAKDSIAMTYPGFEETVPASRLYPQSTLMSPYMTLDGTVRLGKAPDGVSVMRWATDRMGRPKENAITLRLFNTSLQGLEAHEVEWDTSGGSETLVAMAYPQGLDSYPDGADRGGTQDFLIMPEGLGVPPRGIEVTITLARGTITTSSSETMARYGDGRRYCLPKNPSGE